MSPVSASATAAKRPEAGSHLVTAVTVRRLRGDPKISRLTRNQFETGWLKTTSRWSYVRALGMYRPKQVIKTRFWPLVRPNTATCVDALRSIEATRVTW